MFQYITCQGISIDETLPDNSLVSGEGNKINISGGTPVGKNLF